MSPEKKQEILDSRDHEDTIIPPGFTPQPENQGKILFLSGPPGAGKSTTGQYLAKQKGWVYYEADCFANSVDPFIPLDVDEPGHATSKQKRIRGFSKEDLLSFSGLEKLGENLLKGDLTEQECVFPFFKAMSKDIATEKRKIGGDWVVAFAAPTRKIRDVIKEECNAIFVVLTVSEETQKQRVSGRHAEDDSRVSEWLTSMQKGFESVQADEKDAYELIITPELGKYDIAQKVLDLIKDDPKENMHGNGDKKDLQEPSELSEPKKSSMCILI